MFHYLNCFLNLRNVYQKVWMNVIITHVKRMNKQKSFNVVCFILFDL